MMSSAVVDAEVAWGLLSRGIAAAYLITFVSLYFQVIALAGRDGILPASTFLAHARRCVPRWSRFVHWPTVFWVSSSDEALQGACLLGAASAVVVLIGGPYAPVATFFMWALHVSLVTVNSEFLLFPWDCLQLECGFLSLLLPPTQSLLAGRLAMAVPETPVALAFTLLLFRVMVGMGKLKFGGPFFSPQNLLYLKWFMIQQPVPTFVSWFIYNYVPDRLFEIALFAMFFVEIVVPPAFFLPQPLCGIAALLTVGLQVGIIACGNYGVFNVLTAALCLPLLSDYPLLASPASLSTHYVACLLVVLVHSLLAVFQLPFSSYTTRFWAYTDPRPPWTSDWPPLRFAVDACGWLGPLHLAHSYGVFGVESPPAARQHHKTVLVVEGACQPRSHGDWREYEWRYFACDVAKRPPFFAPHHPRVDQQVFYQGRDLCACHSNLLNPFRWDLHWMDALALALKRGSPAVRAVFASDPFADAPPTHLRLKAYTYRFSTPEERAREGVWYKRTFVALVEPDLGRAERCELLSEEEIPEFFVWWRKWVFERGRYVPDPKEVVEERVKMIELYPGMFD